MAVELAACHDKQKQFLDQDTFWDNQTYLVYTPAKMMVLKYPEKQIFSHCTMQAFQLT